MSERNLGLYVAAGAGLSAVLAGCSVDVTNLPFIPTPITRDLNVSGVALPFEGNKSTQIRELKDYLLAAKEERPDCFVEDGKGEEELYNLLDRKDTYRPRRISHLDLGTQAAIFAIRGARREYLHDIARTILSRYSNPREATRHIATYYRMLADAEVNFVDQEKETDPQVRLEFQDFRWCDNVKYISLSFPHQIRQLEGEFTREEHDNDNFMAFQIRLYELEVVQILREADRIKRMKILA